MPQPSPTLPSQVQLREVGLRDGLHGSIWKAGLPRTLRQRAPQVATA